VFYALNKQINLISTVYQFNMGFKLVMKMFKYNRLQIFKSNKLITTIYRNDGISSSNEYLINKE